jgi:hypothetical protein
VFQISNRAEIAPFDSLVSKDFCIDLARFLITGADIKNTGGGRARFHAGGDTVTETSASGAAAFKVFFRIGNHSQFGNKISTTNR